MRKIIGYSFILFFLSGLGYFLFAKWTSSYDFVRVDQDSLNRVQALSLSEHQEVCSQMSYFSHVSG